MLVSIAYLALLAPSEVLTFPVGGLDREATVYRGSLKKNAPLVFAFHGHGGNMRYSARAYHIHEEWPEATVVYMQGIPTPGMTDPEGKKNGWDMRTNRATGGRDTPFFDAVYDKFVKSGEADPKRVYSMGHSNGAGFTYLLWSVRGEKLAAVGSFSGGGLAAQRPKVAVPAFIGGGTADETVPWRTQKRSIDIAIEVNGVKQVEQSGQVTTYKGANGMEVQTHITDGGHKFDQVWIKPMVEFFKRHRLK